MPTNRNHVGSHTRNALHEMQMEAQSIGHQAQERVQELSAAARDQARSIQNQMTDRITQKPLQSVLIAAGVGVLLGFMFRR